MTQPTTTIAVAEAEANFADVIDRVLKGETIMLTRQGRTIASIVPATKPSGDLLKEWMLSAPSLDGVDLERDRSLPREAEL